MSEGTVTISVPGMAPVTLTDGQLKQVAERLQKKGKGMSDNAAYRQKKGKGMSDNAAYRQKNRAVTGANRIDETTREKLRQLVAKVERLEEEKKGIADDIKEVMAEAKALGFDTKAMRAAIRLRKIEKSEREEAQLVLDLYMDALGD